MSGDQRLGWKNMAVLSERWKNLKAVVYGEGARENALVQWFQKYGCQTVQIPVGEITGCADVLPWENLDILVLGEPELAAKDMGNAEEIHRNFDSCINGAMCLISELLPYLDRGNRKRICFLTRCSASSNESREIQLYPENMIRASRNMLAVILKNRLEKEGYTFRICCMESVEESQNAVWYFLEDRSRDLCPAHEDERRLVMRDCCEREIPW